MRTSDFDYPLPEELIAQHPSTVRDQSRLLVLHRESGRIEHRRFTDILDYLRPGDLLVMNDSKVFPARLRGIDPVTGGKFEILLCDEVGPNDWWTMMRPGKRAHVGKRIAPGTVGPRGVGGGALRQRNQNVDGGRPALRRDQAGERTGFLKPNVLGSGRPLGYGDQLSPAQRGALRMGHARTKRERSLRHASEHEAAVGVDHVGDAERGRGPCQLDRA